MINKYYLGHLYQRILEYQLASRYETIVAVHKLLDFHRMSRFPEFPLSEDWDFASLTPRQTRDMFRGAITYESEDPPFLHLIQSAQVLHKGKPISSEQKRRGWLCPGPGRTPGKSRTSTIDDLNHPLFLALIQLIKEAIHFQQMYSFHYNSSEGGGIHFSTAIETLETMEKDLGISKANKRNIWTPTHELGVPAVLIRLRLPSHAICLHFLPDRPGQQWCCSLCTREELNTTMDCSHAILIRQCLQRIADSIFCTMEFLICSMAQSSAFIHLSDLSSTCFYGNAKKLEFAIVREEQTLFQAPATSGTRIYIARHMSSTKRRSCLTRACTGSATDCTHQRSVRYHIERGNTHCFPSMYELLREQEQITPALNFNLDSEQSSIAIPRHARPLIPSEAAFKVDHEVNRSARNNKTLLLKAATTCHCGSKIFDDSSSDINLSDLRVETTLCFFNYRQELWTCERGHCVTPEECNQSRDGLLWISRDTAFTEVFLFDLLLHKTLGGGKITGQSDIRSQFMFLQTHYMSCREGPRSNQCIRKALITYAMGDVKAITSWVFRCVKCSEQSNGNIYYDKLSFDGQQLGFNIKRDVRYDLYGKPGTPWRRPVDRCTEGTKLAMINQSKKLRGIVTEVLRVRRVSPDCPSVQTLCRTMFTVSLRTKDDIAAALASIKLFDALWSGHLQLGATTTNDTSFETYIATSNSEQCARPFSFINNVNNPFDFHRRLRVVNVFRTVLDCTRTAAVISIALSNLWNDLKAHIPLLDQQFIINYATWADDFLQARLLQISQSESLTATHSNTELQPDLFSGIDEHVEFLHHPFRPPFSGMTAEVHGPLQIWGRKMCRVRNVEEWIAPDNAQLLYYFSSWVYSQRQLLCGYVTEISKQ